MEAERADLKVPGPTPAQPEGQFVEHWDELNLLEVFQQLGVIPSL